MPSCWRLMEEPKMRSSILKRSIVVAGHKTSVSLEDAFWKDLREIAASRRTTLSDLVDTIDSKRQHGNLQTGEASRERPFFGTSSSFCIALAP